MHTPLGLRIARVPSPFLSHVHRPAAPLLSALARAPAHIRSTRAASTASEAKSQPPLSASELVSSTPRLSSPLPASATLNPPASTRPPPLELPVRGPESSYLGHVFRLGKAYTAFYKAGLYAIFTNRRLLSRASTAAAPPSIPSSAPAATFPSRADVLLRERVRHDLSRLPVFGLLVLVCGELTPLVVLVFPRLTPYTCRIPRQADALRRSSEARRAASFRALRAGHPDEHALDQLAAGHACRSLGLTSVLWDKIGLDSPFAAPLARRAVARIVADDAMIRDGGGVGELVDEEVVLACEDRGMDVRGESVERLRSRLQEWLHKTASTSKGEGGAAVKMSAEKEANEKVMAMLLGLESI
ncbi:hypothetical protein F4818DRAFT_430876 [Hypoxylon cercidicola]|nr:hypothetical protein F4818DRAFT_430876 [Hypoxylon cercidicola]